MRESAFTCECGEGQFLTGTDNRSYLARVLPDQAYDAFSQTIDDAIERSGRTHAEKDRACMAWRAFPLTQAWQCYACGCLYIEAADGSRHRFLPASPDVPKRLFARDE